MPSAASAALMVVSRGETAAFHPVIVTVVPRSTVRCGIVAVLPAASVDVTVTERAVRGRSRHGGGVGALRPQWPGHRSPRTVEPASAVPVITMPSAASAALIVLSPPSTP
jgi:hypothetical protein